jgi:hypothetical protein
MRNQTFETPDRRRRRIQVGRLQVVGVLLLATGALTFGAAAVIQRDFGHGVLAACCAALATLSAMNLRSRAARSGLDGGHPPGRVPNIQAELAVHIVGNVLDEVHPHNIDRDSITVTGEGESVGIVLIPHRDLGGLALVLSMDPNYAELCWAGVSDLAWHDDLDLGKRIVRIERSNPGWESELRSQIITEFGRRINVTVRRNWRGRLALWCTIEVKGRPANLWIARLSAINGAGRAKVVPAGDTSLQGPETPTVSYQVPLATWLKVAVAAWPAASHRDG